jgi:2'-5' RNA ligase
MPSFGSSRSYALWLIPAEEVRPRLASAIRRLSRELRTPAFAPHITLVSSIRRSKREVLSGAARLARQTPRLAVQLTGIEGQSEYFRCLFAKVRSTRELVRARRMAERIFAVRPPRRFTPHLSMVYGDLTLERKRKVAESLFQYRELEFEVRRMHVVRIQGAPHRWRRVGSFLLMAR